MTKRILVPIDASEVSRDMISLAGFWAELLEAEALFMHVNPKQKENQSKDFLQNLLDESSLNFKYQALSSIGIPYQEIIEEAKLVKPEIIMMAAHSHSKMARIFLGSNTEHVINQTSCSVYVYRRSVESLNNKIMVPLNLASDNAKVVALADRIAAKRKSKLIFIHVANLPEFASYDLESGWHWDHEAIMEFMEERKQELVDYLAGLKLMSPYELSVEYGKPYERILHMQTKLNCRLIVMASHSKGMLEQLFTGSTTRYMLNHVNCPLLVYKEAIKQEG